MMAKDKHARQKLRRNLRRIQNSFYKWIPVFIILLFGLCFWQAVHGKEEAKARALQRKEHLGILLENGYYREILQYFRKTGEARTPEEKAMRFQCLLVLKREKEAYAYGKNLSNFLQESRVRALLEGCLHNQEEGLAWQILTEEGNKLSGKDRENIRFSLFENPRERVCQADLVCAWVYGFAIFRDEQGEFPVNSQGRRVCSHSFEKVIVTEKGLFGMNQKQLFQMNRQGSLLSVQTVDEKERSRFLDRAKNLPVDKAPAAAGQELLPRVGEGGKSLLLGGRVLLKGPFVQLTELSSYGIAYARREKQWIEFRFPALSRGISLKSPQVP